MGFIEPSKLNFESYLLWANSFEIWIFVLLDFKYIHQLRTFLWIR